MANVTWKIAIANSDSNELQGLLDWMRSYKTDTSHCQSFRDEMTYVLTCLEASLICDKVVFNGSTNTTMDFDDVVFQISDECDNRDIYFAYLEIGEHENDVIRHTNTTNLCGELYIELIRKPGNPTFTPFFPALPNSANVKPLPHAHLRVGNAGSMSKAINAIDPIIVKQKCRCDLNQLMRGEGHDPHCTDRK
jgi:hypothetical protein